MKVCIIDITLAATVPTHVPSVADISKDNVRLQALPWCVFKLNKRFL